MSKRYKGKDAHYRLQIKKDGEWQDLGLVASAEMDNKNVDDTTTTNFDEKYIHRNDDKNDGELEDVKVTDLTFQTSKLGKTPKIIFKNTDTSTWDFAEIYLDTQTVNKSTLRFVLGDDKGGESISNNETISFDWRNVEENSRATYYTFTESKLQASSISAHFKQGVFSNSTQNALEVTGHLKMNPGSTICPDNTKGIYFSGANDQARIYSTTTEAAKIYSTTTRDNQINYSSIGDDSALNITVAGDATKAADSDASALNFLIADNNNDKINFRWSVWDGDVGASNNPINAYSFSKTALNATTVTANFATIQSNTYKNSDGTQMLKFSNTGTKWETNIYNGQAGKDSTLTIWGSNKDNTAEASIQYRNQAEDKSWTVGVNTSGSKDNSFAWYSHQSAVGNRMWLTHDGELNLQNKIVLRPANRPAAVHASTTPLTLYDDAINFHHKNDSAWIGFPTADGEKSTFEFGISDDGISDGDLGDKIQFAWYDTTGIAQSKIFIPKENGAHTLATQEHVSDRYLPLAGGTMSGEIYFSCSDDNVQYYGLNWSKDENALHLFSELQNEQLTLKISDGTNTIRFNRASMSFNDKSTISFNDIDQCLDFLF